MMTNPTLADISEHDQNIDDEDKQLIPTMWDTRDRTYDLWRTFDGNELRDGVRSDCEETADAMCRIEAHGVRDGYARRMYGVIGAVRRRYVFTESEHGFSKVVWAVYVRYEY